MNTRMTANLNDHGFQSGPCIPNHGFLSGLGFKKTHAAAFTELNRAELEVGRVVRQDRDRYRVQTADSVLSAQVSGRYRHESSTSSDYPVIGDWVAVRTEEDGTTATVHHLLPRFSQFSRKVAGKTTREQIVASNVDTVFLVSGLDGDFNLRRIERYVTLSWNSGAQPVIVLNKADLAHDIDSIVSSVENVVAGVDVAYISATLGTGMEKIRSYLVPSKTIALLGSSGVGKSSIVNSLLGQNKLETGSVREDDSRGRHTTTFRELFILPGGGVLIDTPGMRELQLWTDENSVQNSFAEIELLTQSCRFGDCCHESEPGCAIRDAIESGELALDRYQSYQKQCREIAYLDRRKKESNHEERKHDRSLGRMYKDIQRHNRKNK